MQTHRFTTTSKPMLRSIAPAGRYEGSADADAVVDHDAIEKLQLRRLASAVLTKSVDDLAALATTNPALFDDWTEAFRREKLAAEAEARYWSSAMAALATASPAMLAAAE